MDCEGCTFSVAASQIRLRNVTDSELRVHMPNREGFIIEASHGLRVGPWEVGFDGDARAFDAAGMALDADNFWDVVYDFTKDVSYGRPHYTYVPPAERAPRTRLLLRPSGYCGGAVEALAAEAEEAEEVEEVEEVEEEYVDDYEDDEFDEEPAPSDPAPSASAAPQSDRAAASRVADAADDAVELDSISDIEIADFDDELDDDDLGEQSSDGRSSNSSDDDLNPDARARPPVLVAAAALRNETRLRSLSAELVAKASGRPLSEWREAHGEYQEAMEAELENALERHCIDGEELLTYLQVPRVSPLSVLSAW